MSAVSKTLLRRDMLAKRESLSIEQMVQAGKHIAEQLLKTLALAHENVIPRLSRDPDPAMQRDDSARTQTVIGLYHPTRGEVDTLQAAAALHKAGYTLALPCVNSDSKILTFRAWQPDDALQTAHYNISCPADTTTSLVPSMLIVPLVAVDKQGFRLGYGGGYYDATIAHLKKANPKLQTIGLAYDFQRVDSLPIEAHDVRLDTIIFAGETGSEPLTTND